MTAPHRWDPAIRHRDSQAREFLASFFADAKTRCLLIGGAGFDPRSTVVSTILASAAAGRIEAVLFREQRPSPADALVQAAESNASALAASIPGARIVPIEVFARDGAVTGGRSAIRSLEGFSFGSFTDVLIDVSALSVGVFFPLVKFLDESISQRFPQLNLHLVVADDPALDNSIEAQYADAVVAPHGFQGRLQLDANAGAARLWMPHLSLGKRPVLDRVFRWLNPDDVCPILPFPATSPRRTDELIDHFRDELESVWDVHARNVVYADESNPLDVYRAILRIDSTRRRVFEQVGGSLLVLSPVGTKPLAVGTLLAAIERDFPVRYVEPVEYLVKPGVLGMTDPASARLFHIWMTRRSGPPSAPPEDSI
jgi:hypothetical protein